MQESTATPPVVFVDPTAPVGSGPQPAAEQKREIAFSFDPHFQGRPLKAFTIDRQWLVGELMASRIGPSAGAPAEAFMPEICAILYLCSHEPEQWRSLRANAALFWEAIERWAETNVPRKLWDEASILVYGQKEPYVMGLWEAARTGVVMPKRGSDDDGDDDDLPGKSPRP